MWFICRIPTHPDYECECQKPQAFLVTTDVSTLEIFQTGETKHPGLCFPWDMLSVTLYPRKYHFRRYATEINPNYKKILKLNYKFLSFIFYFFLLFIYYLYII